MKQNWFLKVANGLARFAGRASTFIGAITLVLPRRIGAAEVVRDMPDTEIAAALEAMYA